MTFEEELCHNALAEAGWEVHPNGWPDFLCEKDGVLQFIEVKRRLEPIRFNQWQLFQTLERGGIRVMIAPNGDYEALVHWTEWKVTHARVGRLATSGHTLTKATERQYRVKLRKLEKSLMAMLEAGVDGEAVSQTRIQVENLREQLGIPKVDPGTNVNFWTEEQITKRAKEALEKHGGTP